MRFNETCSFSAFAALVLFFSSYAACSSFHFKNS
jgi:hypothetical protein